MPDLASAAAGGAAVGAKSPKPSKGQEDNFDVAAATVVYGITTDVLIIVVAIPVIVAAFVVVFFGHCRGCCS